MGRVVLGFLILLSACSFDLLGPEQGSLEFGARVIPHGEKWLEEPIVQVTGESGRIVVNAKLAAPDPCQELSADLQGRGSGLTLRVAIARNSPACVAALGHFEYDAVIGELAPGTYRLRVVHTYPETGWPTVTALDRTVQVQ